MVRGLVCWIKDVDDKSTFLWRENWLKIVEVPLIGWSYEIFYKIGCVFRRTIYVNYKEYNYAYVMVFTGILLALKNKLSLKIDGK